MERRNQSVLLARGDVDGRGRVLPEGGYTWHSTVGPWRLDYDNVVAPADDGSRLRFTARLNGPASALIERLVAPLSALGQRRRIARLAGLAELIERHRD